MASRRDLAGDFRNTLAFIWHKLHLPSPTPIQYDIASFLADPSEDRIIIEAFRGVGKSWITAAFCIWCWLRNPNIRILVVSGSKPRADKFAQFVRRLIYEIPEFHHLRPAKGQRDSINAFDVGPSANAQAPSATSLGITGQLTGNRADLIIGDDVETLNNSLTQTARDSLRETVKEFDSILSPGGRIVFLGTPQYEASLYNELRRRGYKCRIWPARYPAAKQVEGYEGALALLIWNALKDNEKLEGQPTDPRRFSEADLLKREASLGRSTFQLQFMLDTSLSDQERFPLKISDLILHPCAVEKGPISLDWSMSPAYVANNITSVGFAGDVWRRPMFFDPERLPYSGTVMAIDPAGRGGDETAYSVIKMLNGRLFLTAAGGLPGGYDDDSLKTLAMVAQYQKVNQVVVEANFGDGMFSKLLQPILTRVHPCAIEEVWSTVQKERRIIDTLEPIMNQHRLVINEEVAVNDYQDNREHPQKQLFWQMTRLTKERGCLGKDDRIDTLAIACGHWLDAMARDTERAAEDARLELLEAEDDDLLNSWTGGSQEADSWIHLP